MKLISQPDECNSERLPLLHLFRQYLLVVAISLTHLTFDPVAVHRMFEVPF